MPDYLSIKSVHVACVAASYLLFLVRGIWMIGDSPMLRRRWVRVLPHVNDALLLAAQTVFFCIAAVAVTRSPLVLARERRTWRGNG